MIGFITYFLDFSDMDDFSLLSRFDNLLASVFLDGVYVWFANRKVNDDLLGVVCSKEPL